MCAVILPFHLFWCLSVIEVLECHLNFLAAQAESERRVAGKKEKRRSERSGSFFRTSKGVKINILMSRKNLYINSAFYK